MVRAYGHVGNKIVDAYTSTKHIYIYIILHNYIYWYISCIYYIMIYHVWSDRSCYGHVFNGLCNILICVLIFLQIVFVFSGTATDGSDKHRTFAEALRTGSSRLVIKQLHKCLQRSTCFFSI